MELCRLLWPQNTPCHFSRHHTTQSAADLVAGCPMAWAVHSLRDHCQSTPDLIRALSSSTHTRHSRHKWVFPYNHTTLGSGQDQGLIMRHPERLFMRRHQVIFIAFICIIRSLVVSSYCVSIGQFWTDTFYKWRQINLYCAPAVGWRMDIVR